MERSAVALTAALVLTVLGMMLVIAGVLVTGLFLVGAVLIGIGMLGFAVSAVLQLTGRGAGG